MHVIQMALDQARDRCGERVSTSIGHSLKKIKPEENRKQKCLHIKQHLRYYIKTTYSKHCGAKQESPLR